MMKERILKMLTHVYVPFLLFSILLVRIRVNFLKKSLVFNCILVGCPFTVSLPGELECSKAEKEVLDALLQEIKAAWPKMRNTSIEEFQSSFIEP